VVGGGLGFENENDAEEENGCVVRNKTISIG
jgi:hypothetical protein